MWGVFAGHDRAPSRHFVQDDPDQPDRATRASHSARRARRTSGCS
jgi:hypothetical protein